MNQKDLKKTEGFKIGIPWKGCNSSKSLSPVTIHAAFAASAKSRNLSSF